jgi:hypothetical protein
MLVDVALRQLHDIQRKIRRKISLAPQLCLHK